MRPPSLRAARDLLIGTDHVLWAGVRLHVSELFANENVSAALQDVAGDLGGQLTATAERGSAISAGQWARAGVDVQQAQRAAALAEYLARTNPSKFAEVAAHQRLRELVIRATRRVYEGDKEDIALIIEDVRDSEVWRTSKFERMLKVSTRQYAELLTRTEMLRAYSHAHHTTAREIGYGRKYWVAASDAQTRAAHAEAASMYSQLTPISIDDPFIVDGEPLQYPRDPAGSLGNTIQCRCRAIYMRE